MEVDTGTLIVAIAAFIGVIVSPIIAAVMNARQSQKDREDNQRKEWHNFLIDRMNQLIQLQHTLSPQATEPRYNLILNVRSQAISVMLSVDDDEMRKIVEEMPPPKSAENMSLDVDKVISKAVGRLGKLIAETMRR